MCRDTSEESNKQQETFMAWNMQQRSVEVNAPWQNWSRRLVGDGSVF